MRVFGQIVLGVIPACVMTLSGLMFAGAISVVGGVTGAIAALAVDARNNRLGSPLALLLRLLVTSWLILGPATVGLLQARRAVQTLRAVS
jgi:hypothetical protein